MGLEVFHELARQSLSSSRRLTTHTVQLNLGAMCNQKCRHCHVGAGPHRHESMSDEVIDAVLEVLGNSPDVRTLDLTGGAPELHPRFREIVRSGRDLGLEVIDHCNLTVLREKGQEDTASFLANSMVHIISSLPCYTENNVDAQRCSEAFIKSIEILQELNVLGYGKKDTELFLDLVYNPGGAFLPDDQRLIENEYRIRLDSNFGIVFNHLFTMANIPIARFKDYLDSTGAYESYLDLLETSFNPDTIEHLMCKNLISVGWDGRLHDCDFNRALGFEIREDASIFSLESFSDLSDKNICYRDHCLACTAGSGSSCFGTVCEVASSDVAQASAGILTEAER